METKLDQPSIDRQRISREQTFPVGYELLRDALGDTPQWSGIRLGFKAQPGISAVGFNRVLAAGVVYPVVSLFHRFHEKRVSNYRGEYWALSVYPVLRQHRSVARASLLSGPLAGLRELLLNSPEHPTCNLERQIWFNPNERTCTLSATQWPGPPWRDAD